MLQIVGLVSQAVRGAVARVRRPFALPDLGICRGQEDISPRFGITIGIDKQYGYSILFKGSSFRPIVAKDAPHIASIVRSSLENELNLITVAVKDMPIGIPIEVFHQAVDAIKEAIKGESSDEKVVTTFHEDPAVEDHTGRWECGQNVLVRQKIQIGVSNSIELLWQFKIGKNINRGSNLPVIARK